jgi:hypothetical protein
MKKIIIVVAGFLLTLSPVLADGTATADQKWLTAVQKMVAEGQTKVSTPKKERLTLLKEWATKNGYSIQVTQNDAGYRIALSKNLAKN